MSALTASPPYPLINIRRGELKRLFLHRGTSKLEVHNLVEDIIAERARWTAPALGRRVDLIFHEKITLGIRTIACIDRTKRMVRLYFREQKRERDRLRWNCKKQTLARDLSPFARQVADRLAGGKWMRVAEMLQLFGKGRRPKHEAARSAVRRALNELMALGVLEDRMEVRPTGGFERFVRLKKPDNAALHDSPMRERTVIIDVFGEASDFRPSVQQPSVNFSPSRRRNSTKPGTSHAQPLRKVPLAS